MDPEEGVKILHLIDSGGFYGAERVVLTLMAEQTRLGLIPILGSIAPKSIDEKPIEKEAKARGLSVKKIRMANGPNVIGACRILREAIKDDICVIHSHGYKGDILVGLVKWAYPKIPLVSTIHGWTSMGGGRKISVYEWLDSRMLKLADAVVLVSNEMVKNENMRKFGNMEHTVINNGIQPIVPNPNLVDDEVRRFCAGGTVIGSIGRLSPEKGHVFLLRAFHRILQEGGNAKLVLLGDGGSRSSLEAEIRTLRLESKVLLPGYKDGGCNYLPLFDLFVLPSLTEGLPVTLLEAMSCGTPIVSTRVGGIAEALENGEAGLLVEAGDIDELKEAIWTLYRNPELGKKLALKAKVIVEQRYSAETMARRYLGVYERVAA